MEKSWSEDEQQERGRLHPLRAARLVRQLSMQDVCNLAGFSDRRRIWEWETGQHIPTVTYASLLAPVLGFASAEAVRAACRAWLAEEALYSHSLTFVSREARERFLPELPPRTTCFGTTDTESGFVADLLSQGMLSEEHRKSIEAQFHPVHAAWNTRGSFERNLDAGCQDEE